MNNSEIVWRLFDMQDIEYKEFQCKLMPTVEKDAVIGVRTPMLRKFASELVNSGEYEEFLNTLPHKYYEENNLHGFIISLTKDFDKCVMQVENFLPYVDNWATCDSMNPKVFKKHSEKLIPYVENWLKSPKIYTVRFAIGVLMSYFLDERFDVKYARMVSEVKSNEYYINMMIAWYFATALAKQYDNVICFVENNVLDKWTHNKTVQKAVESHRITENQKAYIKSLKM